MPVRLAIVTDRGKGSKEQGNLVVKEAVQACMALWSAPFKCVLCCVLRGPCAAAARQRCRRRGAALVGHNKPNILHAHVPALGRCPEPAPPGRRSASPLLPEPGPSCRAVIDGGYTGMLEATGADVCDWLLSDGFEARLFTFFPCTDITTAVANQARLRGWERRGLSWGGAGAHQRSRQAACGLLDRCAPCLRLLLLLVPSVLTCLPALLAFTTCAGQVP